MLKKINGQTSIEYAVLIIIIIGVLLTIGVYFKRGVQGRWRAATDDLGDQFDPRIANTSIREEIVSETTTVVVTNLVAGRLWTTRTDSSVSTEGKGGFQFIPGTTAP